MRECGTPDVPSFYALRKMQAKLMRDVGLKPRHHTSSLDNQFYMNHPNDLIRLDFGNPLVREHLNFYPEVTTTVSESWQASKWVNEIESDNLTPMWANWKAASHRHFYIKELAQCHDATYIVPLKWIIYDKKVHAEAYLVTREASGIFTVEEHKVIRILATDLQYNFLDLREQGDMVFSSVQNVFKPYTPHPTRLIARGRPVFVLCIMPWADDVSRNRTKQYNVHMNMYFTNLNIPYKYLAQEYFVHFCATSPHAGSLEQFAALAEDCKQDDWSPAYDSELQQEILFRIGIHLLPADNPQQAETTLTSGSSATYWCREDNSGGSASHRETDEGYHALFSPGQSRKPEETMEKIREQIRAACRGVTSAVEQIQTESRVKDKIAVHWIEQLIDKAREIQKERVYNRGTRDLRLNDPKIKGDDREEIKQAIIDEIQEELYTWVIIQPSDRYQELDEHSSEEVNDDQGALFAARLQSASIDGLSIQPLRSRYMVQYKKSLVGKHYKALQQLAVFQLDAQLCSPALFELWKANEIKNMDEYCADLTIAIDNVLDHWAVVDPTRITLKYKLHVLSHLPEAVTEIFECWNAVFRLCTPVSVAGGNSDDGDWTRAGLKIQGFLAGNKQLQRRLGWTPQNMFKPGASKFCSKAKQSTGTWKTVLDVHWKICQTEPGTPGRVMAGRELPRYWYLMDLIPLAKPCGSVQIPGFHTRHERLDMPVMTTMNQVVLVKPEHLLFKFNAQHDCQHFSFRMVRIHTDPENMSHSDNSCFLINMHGLHNAHLIRETLPRHLTEPRPLFSDRRAKHFEFAAALREVGPEKRALATTKTQATKVKNRQEKVDKAAGAEKHAE
ncbi:hypothetical protein B0H17DRAFT_1162742 [Mycena rosella]|uniref:Uncharacterized protein n=1 Tax=Mycena rosella TaxID=1033263 RepID=A0AAD7CUR3_MYCRO|nr:hypothetical protein B0H17DRAFT_1162742 [Mycena rosella]